MIMEARKFSIVKPTLTTVSIIFLVFFIGGINSPGECFKQDMTLYLRGGNAIYIENKMPDLSEYRPLFPSIERVCIHGAWQSYSAANFTGGSALWGGGFSIHDEFCFSSSIHSGSVRHFGASDTRTDALSLYTGTYYHQEEIYIPGTGTGTEGGILLKIKEKIKSYVATGSSDWTLFEGPDLDGAFYCVRVPVPVENSSGEYAGFNPDLTRGFNLTNVGSVFKGCDAEAIQNYKKIRMLTN